MCDGYLKDLLPGLEVLVYSKGCLRADYEEICFSRQQMGPLANKSMQ